MNKFVLLIFLVTVWFRLDAVIKELNHFRDIEHMVESGDWIILDIDNTLITGKTYWGSDEWFHHQLKKADSWGIDCEEYGFYLNEEWLRYHKLCKSKTVEDDMVDVIHRLQKKGFVVFAMTARSETIDIPTLDTLNDLGINFEASFPCDVQIDFSINNQIIRFLEGVLFCGYSLKKGSVFTHFARHLQAHGINLPKRILFVDDNMTQIIDMDKQVTQMGVEIIALHYPFFANRKQWNSLVAEIQAKYVKRILSDEEAKILLNIN